MSVVGSYIYGSRARMDGLPVHLISALRSGISLGNLKLRHASEILTLTPLVSTKAVLMTTTESRPGSSLPKTTPKLSSFEAPEVSTQLPPDLDNVPD